MLKEVWWTYEDIISLVFYESKVQGDKIKKARMRPYSLGYPKESGDDCLQVRQYGCGETEQAEEPHRTKPPISLHHIFCFNQSLWHFNDDFDQSYLKIGLERW